MWQWSDSMRLLRYLRVHWRQLVCKQPFPRRCTSGPLVYAKRKMIHRQTPVSHEAGLLLDCRLKIWLQSRTVVVLFHADNHTDNLAILLKYY